MAVPARGAAPRDTRQDPTSHDRSADVWEARVRSADVWHGVARA